MSAQFLVCPPPDSAFSGPRARRQWDRFVETLACAGNVRLIELASRHDTPGLVFPAHGALIVGKLAVVSTFRHAEDRREQSAYRHALARAGLATTFLKQTYFEGSADALYDPVRPLCYAGYGWRTERSATLQLTELVGCRVLALMLVDERFVHLNSVLCPLASGHVLAYMPALSPHAQSALHRIVGTQLVIEVDADDALQLACNAVEIDDVLIVHRVSNRLRARLNAIGHRLFCTELDEFVANGGSARSLALRLDDGPYAAAAAS